jgi:glycosyltransferase involved in cell wall biosynthesis
VHFAYDTGLMRDSERARVMFVTSPRSIGADTFIHLLLLKHLSHAGHTLHAAGQAPGYGEREPAHALRALSAIPMLNMRAAHFGPSFTARTRPEQVKLAFRHAAPVAWSFAGLVRYIRKHRIQILHSSDRPRDALACVTLAAATGAKSLIHVHVKYGDWMSRGVKWALGRADALVGVSRFVAGSLVASGHSPARVHAVLNAIDISKWDGSTSPEPARHALGVKPDTPLIVSVARLFHWKGQSELIRALPEVKRAAPGVKLAIVGADYPAGSNTTQQLRQLAHGLGVADDVVFTGHREDIAALLAACDVFALPSFEEPFGLVYAEAMAMKRPVVALSNGGTPEVVEHEKSGLLSAPGDTAQLAHHLSRLLNDRALRVRFGTYGRAQVEARFSAQRMASDFSALYARLLA